MRQTNVGMFRVRPQTEKIINAVSYATGTNKTDTMTTIVQLAWKANPDQFTKWVDAYETMLADREALDV